MASRAHRQMSPRTKFSQDLLYRVRTQAWFSQLTPRESAFMMEILDFKLEYECELIPGRTLKRIWKKHAEHHGYDPENMDIISKCLADSIIIPA